MAKKLKIGAAIRELRGDITLSNLAKEIGVTPQELSRWELGHREPSITNLVRIAQALRVKVDRLLSNTGD